jgi:SAM-dependent methyltransferase
MSGGSGGGEGGGSGEGGGFKDHFSGYAADYAAHRPGYPPVLFERLAALPRRHALALDCATGNGQAATGLAEHFDRVLAIDASTAQLANAVPHPRVEYREGRAEHTGVESGTVDLVCAGQAVHWFDLEGFYAEARRVLAPGGAVAVFTYNLVRVDPGFDRVVDRLAYEVVGAYWPPERRWVDEEYRTLPFPFAEVAVAPLEHHLEWDLGRLLLYFGTWSATQRYRKANGHDPVLLLQDELTAAWGGDPAQPRRVRWPIFIRAGYDAEPPRADERMAGRAHDRTSA